MTATHPVFAPNAVGVRELRQNLSRYLKRVKDGETLIVTVRGREVARLVPSRPCVDPN
jgi:prevent-host-death family protein